MSQEEPTCAVIYQSETLPKKPTATILDWALYYVYNFFRKPLVWKKQKELIKILNEIQLSLELEVIPVLFKNLNTCQQCREAYMALKGQVFLSQIEAILTRMACSKHKLIFSNFLVLNNVKFRQSEETSKWINGFSK